MKPFSRSRLIDVCKSIWGPGYYKWEDKDTKDLQGRVLQVQKLPMKDSTGTIVHFKIRYADEPGKSTEMEVQSKCGVHTYELSKILRCRLWGRDYYLDTRGDEHVKSSWEGKTFQVTWRIRGGLYKEDTWLDGPNPLEDTSHTDYKNGAREERDVTCLNSDGSGALLKANQVRQWIDSIGDRYIKRNNQPWNGVDIIPGDKFEACERRKGGSGPKKYPDPFSVKNFNPRMARRKRVEAAARALREKHQAEEELEDSIRWRSTSVTYEGEEFVTREFVNDEWNKQTARRFGRWIRNFSGLERPFQRLIDADTNSWGFGAKRSIFSIQMRFGRVAKSCLGKSRSRSVRGGAFG
jgi:hypothetical protein